MKHLATIHVDFLKEARKWDDLSYEEQKGYLQRHPKTKRRITARPEQSQSSAATTNLESKPELPVAQPESAAQTHLKEMSQVADKVDFTNPQEIKDWIEKAKTTSWALRFYPHINEYDPEQIANAYKEQKAKIKAWPEQHITDSFKISLKRLFSGAETFDDDPVRVSKTKDGIIKSVSMDFRYLGKWIDRPGEEDDDHPTWSRESAEKYTNMFKDWAKQQSWFDKNTMEMYTRGSEKAWVEFGVERKRPE